MSTRWNKIIIGILTALFLGTVVLLAFNSIGDFDTGFHLTTGKYIYQTLSVPRYDVFSYTAPHARLVAHYWLADLLFYVVWLGTGYWGLIVFVALIALLTYTLLLAIIRVRTKLYPLLFVLLIPFLYFTVELWVVRPQIFSYLFTVLLVFLFEKWRRTGNRRILYSIPPLLWIWANMHAGVVLGIAIVVLYCIDAWWQKRMRQRTIPRTFWWTSLVAIALTFANPNGYLVHIYSWIIAAPSKELAIMEWRSILLFLNKWQSWAFLVLIGSSLVFVSARLFRHSDRGIADIDVASLGLVVGASILPIISIRHVGFFPLLAGPIVVREAGIWLRARKRIAHGMLISLLSVAVGAVALVGGALHVYKMPSLNVHLLPVGATNFIQKHHITGPFFNSMEEGGYLMWKLWPDEHIFIDGRNEVYEGEINKEYTGMIFGVPGWGKVFDSYNFKAVVLRYRSWSSWRGAPVILNFIKRLVQEKGYVLVWWDDAALVLVKDDIAHNNIIAQYGYKVIGPQTDPNTIPIEKWKQAESELNRALKQSTVSRVVERYAFQFVLHRKQVQSSSTHGQTGNQ